MSRSRWGAGSCSGYLGHVTRRAALGPVTAHLAYWLPTLSQAARTGMEPRVLMLGDIGQWVAGTWHTRPVSPHILITDTGAGVINQDCSSLLYGYLSYILQHKTFCNSNNFRFI